MNQWSTLLIHLPTSKLDTRTFTGWDGCIYNILANQAAMCNMSKDVNRIILKETSQDIILLDTRVIVYVCDSWGNDRIIEAPTIKETENCTVTILNQTFLQGFREGLHDTTRAKSLADAYLVASEHEAAMHRRRKEIAKQPQNVCKINNSLVAPHSRQLTFVPPAQPRSFFPYNHQPRPYKPNQSNQLASPIRAINWRINKDQDHIPD